MDFFEYQLKWIFDSSPLAICEKSRQIGITYAESFRCIYERLTEKKNYYFSAQDIKSGTLFIEYCKQWIEQLFPDEETINNVLLLLKR
jgi:phage FluMu gp28-like protein